MRGIHLPTAVFWCATSALAVAQSPESTPAQRQVERRVAATNQGENISTPSAEVQIPPAGTRQSITEQTPETVMVPRAVDAPRKEAPPVSAAARGAAPDDWRYRRHNGQWWYWLPNKTWVAWSGNAWIPYRPSADLNRYATGYRGAEPTNVDNNAGGYDPAHDSYNTYRRRGLSRNRPRANPPAPPASTVPPPVRGSAIQGGGGQGTGGPIGSPQEAGSVRIGAGSSSQSSGARARGNLGTFGTRQAAEKHERAAQYFKRQG